MADGSYNDIDLEDKDTSIAETDIKEKELLDKTILRNDGENNDSRSVTVGASSTVDLGGNESDPWMDDDDEDEFDKLLLEIDENEIIKKAYHGHTTSDDRQTTTVPTNQQEPASVKIDNSNSSDGVFRTPPVPPVAKSKVPAKYPLKRKFNSQTSAFFWSSQQESYNSTPLKRSFPGPAGLLPSVKANEIKQNNELKLTVCDRVLHPVSNSIRNGLAGPQRIQALSKTKVNVLLHKETSLDTTLDNGPWRTLIKSLNLNLKDDDSILNKMNIDWVKFEANKFPLLVKIPLLVLVVKEHVNVENQSSKAKTRMCVRLMDHSGVITAALDNSFVKAYGNKIVPGTSLALTNCRILLHRRSVILTASNSNVLCLSTTKKFNEDQLTPSESYQSEFPSLKVNEHGIYILQLAPFIPEEILQDYEKLVKLMDTSNHSVEFENADNRMMNQAAPPIFTSTVSANDNSSKWIQPKPSQSTNTFIGNNEITQVNFANNDTSGFDDDDDDEFLKALAGMEDFAVDEDD